MSALVATQTFPRQVPWLRLGIVTVATIQLGGTLCDMPNAFADYPSTSDSLIFAQRVVAAELLMAPLIAVTAFALALFGRLNHAVLVLGLLVLAAWIADLPSIAINGLQVSPDFSGAAAACVYFVTPILGTVAVVLAIRDQRLALAGVLASVPTLLAYATIALFMSGSPTHGV